MVGPQMPNHCFELEKKILQVIDILPVYIDTLKAKICYFKASTVC